jgi:hypothetical protein
LKIACLPAGRFINYKLKITNYFKYLFWVYETGVEIPWQATVVRERRGKLGMTGGFSGSRIKSGMTGGVYPPRESGDDKVG